jgi:hypothetical protein
MSWLFTVGLNWVVSFVSLEFLPELTAWRYTKLCFASDSKIG